MRLIDADALILWLDENECYTDRFKRIAGGIIENRPTVDAVPVVRCKDCRYFAEAKVNGKGFLICPASGMEITDNDYCSYGERKGGDENEKSV